SAARGGETTARRGIGHRSVLRQRIPEPEPLQPAIHPPFRREAFAVCKRPAGRELRKIARKCKQRFPASAHDLSMTVRPIAEDRPTAADRSARDGHGRARLFSIDIFRGLIMVWMALDHTRDFFSNLPFEPENLAQTYPLLFATRCITHFC